MIYGTITFGEDTATLTDSGWTCTFPEVAGFLDLSAPITDAGWHPQPWASALETAARGLKGTITQIKPPYKSEPGRVY
jgi:hypothetical protein